MPLLIPPVVDPGAMAGSDQPTVPVADGLLLRPWSFDDVAAVLAAFNEPDIQRWHFRRFDHEQEAEAWIVNSHAGWTAETSANWAIAQSGSSEVVGRVALYPDLKDGHGEISYWVLPAARNRGVAATAAIALTRWAHDQLGLHRVELEHSVDNIASCRVASRAGFRAEGVRRGANLHDDGWHDMHLHSHLSTDA